MSASLVPGDGPLRLCSPPPSLSRLPWRDREDLCCSRLPWRDSAGEAPNDEDAPLVDRLIPAGEPSGDPSGFLDPHALHSDLFRGLRRVHARHGQWSGADAGESRACPLISVGAFNGEFGRRKLCPPWNALCPP